MFERVVRDCACANRCYELVLEIVTCPEYFSHAEGKNSLVNCLCNFCSKRHDGGAPIRLPLVNGVTYCNKWRPKKSRRLKSGRKEFECVSELENLQCEVLDFLGAFFVSWRSEAPRRISLELFRSFLLCVTSHNTFFKDVALQIFKPHGTKIA